VFLIPRGPLFREVEQEGLRSLLVGRNEARLPIVIVQVHVRIELHQAAEWAVEVPEIV
jgi:hypothetical protein